MIDNECRENADSRKSSNKFELLDYQKFTNISDVWRKFMKIVEDVRIIPEILKISWFDDNLQKFFKLARMYEDYRRFPNNRENSRNSTEIYESCQKHWNQSESFKIRKFIAQISQSSEILAKMSKSNAEKLTKSGQPRLIEMHPKLLIS